MTNTLTTTQSLIAFVGAIVMHVASFALVQSIMY